MTTYRLPPRGPTDLNILIALTWLKDAHAVTLAEVNNVLVFIDPATKRACEVPPEALAGCIDGGWAVWDESKDVPEIGITESGRYQAQRFQKLNKL
jgi:hypothetical protein